MNTNKRKQKNIFCASCFLFQGQRGFTLIEMMVLLFIFSITTVTFYQAFAVGTEQILEAKNRRGAVALANQRMEQIRNIPYDDVGVVGGIPEGDLDGDELVTVNTRTYHVLTEARFVDDPDDGTLGGAPNDTVPNDYKIVDITVRWGQETTRQSVQLVSRFVPPGGIEVAAGGGTLSINVLDADANPIKDASVALYNNAVSPTVNFTNTTNSIGNLIIPGAPVADESYKITVSKDDYETVETSPPYPITAYFPTYGHATVIEETLTTVTIIINRLANLTLQTKDPFGTIVPNLDFNLVGGRILGTETDGSKVYNVNQSLVTNGSGVVTQDQSSPGGYEVAITNANYILWKVSPGDASDRAIFDLLPNESATFDVIALDKSLDSIFISVSDAGTNVAIAGASVRLQNATSGFDVSLTTDEYGRAYFPNDLLMPLQNGETYDFTVSATGYSSLTDTVTVDGLVEENVNLLQN